jgi:pyruvate-formate lyase-activating enzyme
VLPCAASGSHADLRKKHTPNFQHPVPHVYRGWRFLSQKSFFDSVHGGITLSGGEPLAQVEFCIEILNGLEGKIHRAVETCGFSSENNFISLISKCDLVIMDIKLAQDDQHIFYTGVSNKCIIKNLKLLKESGIPHIFRTPLIPNITDTEENLTKISQIIGSDKIELLPYNTLAGAKYRGVGRTFTDKINEKLAGAYDPDKIISLFENAKIRK